MDNKKVYSYSLKKKKLKKWIYENNYTLPYVAKRLGISKDELKRKLSEHDGFNKYQIKSLIYLVGASNAIDIIYFPSLIIKNKIISEVFRKGGNMSKWMKWKD